MLTQKHIDTFVEDGVVVIDNVFSESEVAEIRNAFHRHNRDKYNVDHCKLLDGDSAVLACVKGPRIKSPISNTFYPKWKLLDVNTADRVWQLTSHLWAQTYAVNAENFKHPFGDFDHRRGYLFIDRVCYRLPDSIRAEGGLAPHLDRNPYDPYLTRSSASRLTKWRPIQGFVALTDQYGGKSGGLRCVRGFHREIDEYFGTNDDERKEGGEEGGEFYRLQHSKHRRLYERCQPVDCAAGSVVLWDNRIVHSTAEELDATDTREVLYTSFLPAGVPCNDAYAREQWACVCANRVPPAFKDRLTQGADQSADRDWPIESLSQVQAMLLGRQ